MPSMDQILAPNSSENPANSPTTMSSSRRICPLGLGLGDPDDITLKGFNIVKTCQWIYLEAYTSFLCGSCLGDPQSALKLLEERFGKEVILADRELVEQGADEMLEKAKTENVAFLVVGDPFGATTHTDLVLRAKTFGVDVQVIHNASIMNAVGACGLQLYSFGETVSIPFWTDTWRPTSFLDKILENKCRGLHTLCLLDIKMKEPNLECMMKGKIKYDPPRFMTVAQAATQLLEAIKEKQSCDDGSGTPNTIQIDSDDLSIGIARLGTNSQKLVACSLSEMSGCDLGPPLHSLVICGKMHPLELDFVNMFKLGL